MDLQSYKDLGLSKDANSLANDDGNFRVNNDLFVIIRSLTLINQASEQTMVFGIFHYSTSYSNTDLKVVATS